MRLCLLAIMLMTFGLLTACAQPEPTPTPSPIPTPTPEPTSTPTPVPPPGAAPVADATDGTAPLLVSFANTSDGPVTAWAWDFGDGSSSTEQNPTHEYTRAGSYVVRLTASGPGGSDAATLREIITVSPGPLAGLLSPTPITLQVQRTTRLGATAVDQFGNEISDVELTWTVPAPLATIDATGLLTAGTEAGTHARLVNVTATQGEQTREASVEVTITPGPLATVAVEPTEVTLDIGESQPFTFTAFDEFGNRVTDVAAGWTAGGGLGSVGADGLLTAGTTAGAFPDALRVDLVQEAARASASADVSLRPGPLAAIQVTPSSADVAQGATQQFTGVGVDQYGNEIAGLAFLWQATGGDIDQAGVFTATASGSLEVRASATSQQVVITGSASVLTRTPFDVIWRDLIKAAQAEGEVVIAMGGNASRSFGPRFEAFEAEMGIRVIAVTGRGSQQVDKIKVERAAGVFSTDIWMTGVTSAKNINATGALKDNFLDHLILPDVLDPNTWFGGHLWFPNGLENTTIAFCASPKVAFSYNTNLVDASQLTSWWDLVDGRFKGQWVGKFPWEPGQTDSEHFINKPALGEAFIRAFMLEQDAEWVRDGQQAVDLLAKGVKSIFMPTGNASDDIDALEGFGLPVKNHFAQGFVEGGVLGIGGGCTASLLRDAPHPNAQKVFINWWLGKDNLYEAGGLTHDHALRVDVATDNLDPDYVRKPGGDYFFPEADPTVPQDNPGLVFIRALADEVGLR